MKRTLLAAALALLVGCGSRGGLYTEKLQPLAPIATSSALVTVVPQTSTAVLLKADSDVPFTVALSPLARASYRVPGSEVVVVLAGDRKAPVLDLFDAETLERTSLPLPGDFDAAAFSPDGHFALLTYSPSGVRIGQAAARNLNEVALVDLVAQSVLRLQLDTESLAPRQVLFGPSLAGEQLVAVALERGVAVFDAKRPADPPRRVSVRPQGSTEETSVLEAVFAPSGRFLFLRASTLDDVIAVELSRSASGTLQPSVNFLAGGQGLTDIDVLPDAPALSDGVVAAFATTQDAWFLDARGIADNVKRLPLVEALRTVRPLPGGKVLLLDPALRSVTAWDVVSGNFGNALLDAKFDRMFLSEPAGKLVLGHPQVSTGASLSVVTVEDDVNRLRARIQAIQLARPASAQTSDATESRYFFGEQNDAALVAMELSTLKLSEVRLDAPIEALHHLSTGDRLVALHPGNPYGDATLVPAGSLDRAQSVRFVDYLLQGAFDRAEAQ